VRDRLADIEPWIAQEKLASARLSLKGKLVCAAQWNVDRDADVEPIRALIEQGCDLEADILPIVAREVPELSRPLKSWGVKWLADEILSARDQRLVPRHVPSDVPKANEAS